MVLIIAGRDHALVRQTLFQKYLEKLGLGLAMLPDKDGAGAVARGIAHSDSDRGQVVCGFDLQCAVFLRLSMRHIYFAVKHQEPHVATKASYVFLNMVSPAVIRPHTFRSILFN